MTSETVRITPRARRTLKQLAERTGEPMTAILEQALEDLRRRMFLEGLSDDFAALRADPKAWKDELEERAAWDATMSDGLGDE